MLLYPKKHLAQYKLNLNVIVLVSLTSMVFIYPFDSHFRFTMGSVVLSILLLYFRQLPLFSTSILSGVAILILRSYVSFALGSYDWNSALTNNFPALIYYIVLAVTWDKFDIRGNTDNMTLIILKLSLADIFSNLAEIAFHPDLLDDDYETILIDVIAIGIGRAILSLYGYYSLKKYHSFVLAGEQLERYTELTLMIAKLKTELFYLKKSSQDIEQVMEQSYWLYNELRIEQDAEKTVEKRHSTQALTIARSIHEVKKDYYRVITGIENVLKPSTVERGMSLSEIMFIIEQNTLHFLVTDQRNLQITFSCYNDTIINKHYTVVSMLDNLIINAIEACSERGNIKVLQTLQDGYVIFSVEDDGCGISDNDYEIIFKPGYSTKFSPYTGKMSTGLGLAHTQNLVEEFDGTIEVVSQPGYTCFTIRLPYEKVAA